MRLILSPQESHKELDVVRSVGNQRAAAQNLQEPGAASPAGGQNPRPHGLPRRAARHSVCRLFLLQCDGRPIPLPSLQGIAVLNIPSYAGGTNFWGGTKEDDVRTLSV